MLRVTCVVLIAVAGGLWGCSAEPTPMVVLMPTYSFDRDGVNFDGGAARPIDAVAAVEP